MIGNIAYEDYNKKSDIHGTVLYPAVMVAPVQKDILSDIIDKNKEVSIFDPFHGSGTALYESIEISNRVKLYGCDINPLANLICRVKLQGVSGDIKRNITKVRAYIDAHDLSSVVTFAGIDKWFRKDIQESLLVVRNAIRKVKDERDRQYFWCMLSDLIRKYSNSRSSTYKLHIKPSDKISSMENNLIKEFIERIEQNYKFYTKSAKSFKLYKTDTIQYLLNCESNKYDISITSPPYGENATTVPYGQFSMLALHWIDPIDLALEGWEFDSYSSIDTNSLGGKARPIVMNNYCTQLIMPYLKRISDSKQRKVIRFMNDYFIFLNELCRVSKKYIVLTLGNRTVDRVDIDLTNISIQYLEHKGFVNQQILKRDIPKKRMPRRTSRVGTTSVKSINSEYIIIHTKHGAV